MTATSAPVKAKDIERHFGAGECILDRGAATRELYIVHSGEVCLEPGDVLLGPGDLFNEAAAITGMPGSLRAVADSDVVVLALDLNLLQDLCLQNGEFALRLIRHLAERLEGQEEAAPLAVPSPREVAGCVARAIVSRATRPEDPSPVRGRLRELASEAGVDMLAAYYEVQALLEEKLVRLSEDELQILDRAALAELASRSG